MGLVADRAMAVVRAMVEEADRAPAAVAALVDPATAEGR